MKGPSHASSQDAPQDAGTGEPEDIRLYEEPVERFPEGLLDGFIVPPFSVEISGADGPVTEEGALRAESGATRSPQLVVDTASEPAKRPGDASARPPRVRHALAKTRSSLLQHVQMWTRRLGTSLTGSGDTPRRVAGGVALGVFIAFTPTLGLQMLIYAALAAVLPINKLAGFPALFISNPLTAVPIYYAGWWVGARVMRSGPESGAALLGNDEKTGDQVAVWGRLWDALLAVGAEVWVGSLILGSGAAILAYVLTFRYVHRHT